MSYFSITTAYARADMAVSIPEIQHLPTASPLSYLAYTSW